MLDFLNLITSYGNAISSVLVIIASFMVVLFSRKIRSIDYGRAEELIRKLDERLANAEKISKTILTSQAPYLNYEETVMKCPKHGSVKAIVLPDSTVLCPYGHRLWPPEKPFEKVSSLNIDIKENILEAKYHDLQSQINELREKLQELEEQSMAGTVIAKEKKYRRKAEEFEEEFEEE